MTTSSLSPSSVTKGLGSLQLYHKIGTLIKEELKGTFIMDFFFSLVVKKSMTNKVLFFSYLVFTQKDHPRCSNWTLDFEPAFSQRFFAHPEPTILFPNCSAVSHSKTRDFRFHEPAILFSNWSAVSHLKNT